MDLNLGAILDLATLDNGDLHLAALDRALPAWRTWPLSSADEALAHIGDAEVVISNKVPLPRPVLERAAGLKLVVVAATGTDIVDLAAARELGIVVCNVRDYCNASVAQHVMALVFSLAGGQPWYQQRVRDGDWSRSGRFSLHDREIREVSRLSLGIIGHGALGRAVASLARAVGMNILLGERQGRPTRPDRLAFRQLVASVDVVSIHCPLTDETRNIFDRDVFRAMKNDALLINTARGAIVNEQDLADALRSGEIGGAGLDVLSSEPPPPDHPLLADDIPNLIITPHNAWASRHARQACVDQLAEIINSFRRGQPINRVV